MELTRIHKKTIEVLNLNIQNKTSKGWIVGSQCPFCGSDEKFGIKFNVPNQKYTNHISFNCFRGSCGMKGGEFILFKQLGIHKWLNQGDSIKLQYTLTNKISTIEQDEINPINIHVPKASFPLGFKRIYDNEYLNNRGFESWQYYIYHIGISSFQMFRDYVIFLITEDGENKGYVARSTKSNDWINEHNKKVKEYNKNRPKSERKLEHLRYKNEGSVDFAKLLFGVDQITPWTTQIILVEGVTDKANIDRWLFHKDLDQQIVCLCTFGKKISEEQIHKIKSKVLNLHKIIFMYDPDAVNQSKNYSILMLQQLKVQVDVCYLETKDPGDLSFDEIEDTLNQAEPALSFAVNKVYKHELKVKANRKSSNFTS